MYGDAIMPVIMYHKTLENRSDRYSVTVKQLEDDIVYLKEQGYTSIHVSELIDYADGKALLPPKPIMLTIDDGYYCNYKYAYPIFKKHNVKCIMSVVGVYTDENYVDGEHVPTCGHLDYSQIKEMSDSGIVEIQSHTYNMHDAGGARKGLSIKNGETVEDYKVALLDDLRHLHGNIKSQTGISMTAIAYPFGEYVKDTIGIIKEMGYRVGFTCNEGVNRIYKRESYRELYRMNREGRYTTSKFFDNIQKYIDKKVKSIK